MSASPPPAEARLRGPLPVTARRTRRAILLTVCAGASFAVLDSITKTLAHDYPTPMVAWARYVFHVLVMLLVLGPRYGRRLVQTRRPGLQVTRGLCLGFATLTFIGALSLMPLAEASAIVAIGPVLITVAAVLWLGERASRVTIWALAVSFAGVMLIIRPGPGVFTSVAMLPLGTALLGSMYGLLTRKLAGQDDGIATLFISGLVPTILFSALLPLYWRNPGSWHDWLLMALAGALGAAGHLMLVRAYERAPASTLAPYGYAHAVSALPIGWLVFDYLPDGWALAGMALIVASGVASAIAPRPGR